VDDEDAVAIEVGDGVLRRREVVRVRDEVVDDEVAGRRVVDVDAGGAGVDHGGDVVDAALEARPSGGRGRPGVRGRLYAERLGIFGRKVLRPGIRRQADPGEGDREGVVEKGRAHGL